MSVTRGTWGAGLDFDFYYSAIICMVWIWVLSWCLFFGFFPFLIGSLAGTHWAQAGTYFSVFDRWIEAVGAI